MSMLCKKNWWEITPFRCTQNIMQTRNSFVVCILELEEQCKETEQEQGQIEEVVEVAEEEHPAEGWKPIEETRPNELKRQWGSPCQLKH